MSNIKLMIGNSLNLLKNIKTDSIPLIISDPPYNLSKNYGNSKDHMSFNRFIKFSKSWLKESYRVLKPGGTIYVFMGMRMISYIYMIMDKELGFNFKSWITWHYTQGVGKRKGFSSRHDDILMFTKPGGKITFNLNSVRVPQKYYRSVNNMRGANPGNVWNFSHVHYSQKNRSKNPTQKPEGVMERMILASSNKNDTVLDPFSGSGTTVRVCQITNRKGIGIELNPKYIHDTKLRLKEPFYGFDSIDTRMLRVPNDLNKEKIRDKYFHNHIIWFLTNHTSHDVSVYIKSFFNKYKNKLTDTELYDMKITADKYKANKASRYINRYMNKHNKIYKATSLF